MIKRIFANACSYVAQIVCSKMKRWVNLLLFVLITFVVSEEIENEVNPLSEEFIAEINKKATTWKVIRERNNKIQEKK